MDCPSGADACPVLDQLFLERKIMNEEYNSATEHAATDAETIPVAAPPDPFDPARLRLSQDFASTLGVKKALLTVPVKKPAREWFVQVHPSDKYRLQTCVLELKEEREIYLIAPELWPELATEATAEEYLQREWSASPIRDRYHWLYAYDANTAPIAMAT